MSPPKADNSETPPPPQPSIYSTPPAIIALTIALVVVCFICFSIFYYCRCCCVSIIHTWAFQRSASGTIARLSPNNASSPYRGLDPSLLQAFPTFLYGSVKDLRKEKKYCIECAICLVEFEEDSMLRLLTVCYHVFHQECIDLWLLSHKTCPVCRTDLDSPTNNETRKSHEEIEEERRGGDVCIEVKEGDGDQRHDDDDDDGVVSMGLKRFVRSHTTGHSVVMIRGGGEGKDDDDDKYTLRLPEDAALRVVRGGHAYTKSCSSYKDMAMAAAPCSNCDYCQTVFGCSSRSGTQNNLS